MPNQSLKHGRVPTVSGSSLSGNAYDRNSVTQLRAHRHIRLLGDTYASRVGRSPYIFCFRELTLWSFVCCLFRSLDLQGGTGFGGEGGQEAGTGAVSFSLDSKSRKSGRSPCFLIFLSLSLSSSVPCLTKFVVFSLFDGGGVRLAFTFSL